MSDTGQRSNEMGIRFDKSLKAVGAEGKQAAGFAKVSSMACHKFLEEVETVREQGSASELSRFICRGKRDLRPGERLVLQKKEIQIAGASGRGAGTAQEEGKGGAVHPPLPVGERRERKGWTLTMKSSKMERREADLNFVQKQEARSSDEDVTRRG